MPEPEEKQKSAEDWAALFAELIRAIVREELAEYEKRQLQKLRFGLPPNMETK